MMSDSPVSVPSDPNQENLPVKKNKTGRLLLTLLGLICFAGLLYYGGFESFDKITHPDYPWLFTAMIGTGLMVFVFAVRWGGIVNSLVGRRVTGNFNYFFYSLSSLALGAVVPHAAGTIIGRVAALKKFEGVSVKVSGVSILLDKMFDGFFMVMFAWPLFFLVIGRATVGQVVVISLVEFVIVTLLVIINYSFWIRMLQALILVAVKLVSLFPFLKKYSQLQNIEAVYNLKELEVLQRRTVLRAYFLTALGQVMLAVRAWLAAMAIGLDMITPLDTFVAIGLVQAGVLFSFTPGALGFADAAWFVALAGAGVPKEIIAVFLVAFRIIENLAILAWWLPLYLYKMSGFGKKNLQREKV